MRKRFWPSVVAVVASVVTLAEEPKKADHEGTTVDRSHEKTDVWKKAMRRGSSAMSEMAPTRRGNCDVRLEGPQRGTARKCG